MTRELLALPTLLLSGLLVGCEEPAAPAARTRTRLVEVPQAELAGPERPADAEVVWSGTFAAGTDGWDRVADPLDPSAEGDLAARTGADPDVAFLTLEGTRGLLVRLVPVEPGATYAFTGRLRARGLEPAVRPFHGATFWLAELTTSETFAEIARAGLDAAILKRHILPTVAGSEGWQARRTVFRARAGARALLVGCALGTSEDVRAGAVDFRDLVLERVDPRALWEESLRDATTAARGWQAQRRVPAELRAELRPSIALLPGETLTLRLSLPSEQPCLATGLGLWRPALAPGASATARLSVRVDGDEVLARELAAPTEPRDARWQDVEVDLARWAGRVVTVQLACDGTTPGVFGAPSVWASGREERRPNVLLISIDMLRADHVGAYGYGRDTTPNLDRFAHENVLFSDVTAQAPYTLPATVSLFSGQFPSVHGVFRGDQAISTRRSPLLAELLGDAGYRTQAFTAGGFVSADFGLDAGFDGFTNVDPLRHPDSAFFHLLRERSPGLTPELVAEHGPERIAAWLDEHADEPFFLFLHTYTVHDYDAPDGWLPCDELGCTETRVDYTAFLPHVESDEIATPAERAHLDHRYDGALRYVDHLLGELFAHLETLGVADETVVVVTSDHGEEMFERGVIQHGKTLYEELVRIPLIVGVPGVASRVVEEPAMTVDVAPTILAALGLPRDPRMQGANLLAPGLERRVVWSEVNDRFAHKYALRDGQGWKLIHGPLDADVHVPNEREWELYDTFEDRTEREDRTAAEPDRFERLRAALEEHRRLLERLGEGLGGVGTAEVDEETRAQLRALGYIDE